MQRYRTWFLKYHVAAIILALVVGSLTAFPQLIAEHRMGAAYQGVHPVVIDDQLYYLARAHETLDGHPTLGNPYLAEHKDAPGVQFWIPDMVLARFAVLMGGLGVGTIIWSFLFPALITLASYAILFVLTSDSLLALAFTALLDPGIVFASFMRSPNPQLFVVLLVSLLCLLIASKKQNRNVWWLFGAVVSGGALFYIYPFYWTYWVVMLALAAIISFLLLRGTRVHRTLAWVLSGALVLGIPYFFESYYATRLPYYAESLQRIGVIETHFPSGLFIVTLAAIAVAFVMFCWWKRMVPKSLPTVLVVVAAATGAIVTNQHIITGLNYFFSGHYIIPAEFMSVFALAMCVPGLIRHFIPLRFQTKTRVVILCLALLYAAVHVVPQVARFMTPQPQDIAAERYGPTLTWLDANTKIDEVVYADSALSLYIPAYTHNNVFFSSYVFSTYLPQKEVEERYLAWHYFDGLTREKIINSGYDVFGAYYEGRYAHAQTTNPLRRLLGLAPVSVEEYPEADIARLVSAEVSLQKGSFARAVQGYRLDYLVWDTKSDPMWHVPTDLKKLYETDGIIVYKVPEPSS